VLAERSRLDWKDDDVLAVGRGKELIDLISECLELHYQIRRGTEL
jgi:hypothetical protein